MERRPRISPSQMEILSDFLENNKEIAKGHTRSAQARQLTHRKWDEIASTLNSQGDGAVKDGKSWAKYWNDLKSKLKKKAQDISRDSSQTGGGPACEASLSDVELRLLQILGTNYGVGLPGVAVDPFPSQASSSQQELNSIPPLDSNLTVAGPSIENVEIGSIENMEVIIESTVQTLPAQGTIGDNVNTEHVHARSRSRSPLVPPPTRPLQSRPRRPRQRSRPMTTLDQAQHMITNIESKRVEAELQNAKSIASLASSFASLTQQLERLTSYQTSFMEEVRRYVNLEERKVCATEQIAEAFVSSVNVLLQRTANFGESSEAHPSQPRGDPPTPPEPRDLPPER